ncbi:COG4223 family protein [Yoonia algicola]|uniref:Mitochondrial inner membrane protein n=1 Tax=Yoonia algicola TaxID=3137368 RepID=A0AAN0M1H4_9RHOB
MAKQPAKGRKTPAEPKNAAKSGKATSESVAPVQPVVDAIPPEVHTRTAASVPSVKPSETVKTAEKPKPTDQSKAAETPKSVAPEKPKTQNSGFFPLLLGGLLAGVIGFAVASLTTPATDTTLMDQLSAQATQISALEQRIDAAPAVDLSGIEAAQADLATQLSDVTNRIDELEARPATTVISEAAGEGVSAEMDALREQIAEMTNAAQTELEEARAQAASIEENAAAAARKAAARAALSRVQTALESGAPIGAALGDLEAATTESAPAELLAVQDGVPTLANLQDQFPEVARAALATARSEGVSGEETTGFGAFLRNQLDVRSTTPREGDSADAILSRAEAAVRSGRLSDALAEISALPEVARAEMSDWLAQAEQRADAIAAVDILSTSLSDN